MACRQAADYQRRSLARSAVDGVARLWITPAFSKYRDQRRRNIVSTCMLTIYRYCPDATKQSQTVMNKLHRLTERDSRFAHYFALFGGLGLRLGYLATYGAKSDVIFLLSDPLSYSGGEISRVSHVVSEI